MLKRDISAMFLGNVVLAAFALGGNVVTSRVLGPDGRGLLALAILIPMITARVAMFGQESVNQVFPGLYKEARASLFLHSAAFTLLGALVSTLVIQAFYFWLPIPRGSFGQLSNDVIAASCLIAPGVMFHTLLIAFVRGVGKIATASLLPIIDRAVVLVVLLVVLVGARFGVVAAVWTIAVGPLAAGLVSLWFLRREIDFRQCRFRGGLLLQSLRFGWPVCLANLAGYLVYRLDQGILAYVVSEADLGMYALAVGVAEQLRILPASVSVAFLPRLANELEARRGQTPAVFRATIVISLAAMALAGVFGIPAILLLFGREFAGSIPPFLILLPGLVAWGAASVLAYEMLTRQKTLYNLAVGYATLAASIVLNLTLIPLLGIAGSAVAGTLSYCVSLTLWVMFYLRESGRKPAELVPTRHDVVFVWRSGIEMLQLTRSRLLRRGRSTAPAQDPR